MADEVLDRRALNRALLARQLLLERSDVDVRSAVERLVGLQGQSPAPPYYGLWSRIDGFDPGALGSMLTDREAVRMTLMRGTIHLVTVDDALTLRPLMQPAIDRAVSQLLRQLPNLDLAAARAAPAEILASEPLGARALARRLVARGIDADPVILGYAIPGFLPLVQLPPRGVWGEGGQVRYATLESWTGRELDPDPSIDELVLRYLRGFGPASVVDMQSWSGLTGLGEAFERLRDRLVTFRNEDGRELFDLPGAPRPDPSTPAPVRFLGEYDNVLLGHRDRRRIVPEGFRWEEMLASGRFVNNLLVDGMLRATWWIERDGRRRATLGVRPFGGLSAAERAEVAIEGDRILDFAAADADRREVGFEAPLG